MALAYYIHTLCMQEVVTRHVVYKSASPSAAGFCSVLLFLSIFSRRRGSVIIFLGARGEKVN